MIFWDKSHPSACVTLQSVRGEPFDLPFILRLSKDERQVQDRLVEP